MTVRTVTLAPVHSDNAKVGRCFRWNNQERDDNHLEATVRITEILSPGWFNVEIVVIHDMGYKMAQGGHNPGSIVNSVPLEELNHHCSLSEAVEYGGGMAQHKVIFLERIPYPAAEYANAIMAGKGESAAVQAALDAGAFDNRLMLV